MLVNLSYGECLQIFSALNLVSSVYGNACADDLAQKFDKVMEHMDNAPITDLYPRLSRELAQFILDLNCAN